MNPRIVLLTAVLLLGACDNDTNVATQANADVSTSPILQIARQAEPSGDDLTDVLVFRTLDGSKNNLLQPDMNASHSQLRRRFAADYSDLMAAPAGTTRPMARSISNAVSAQPGDHANARRASDYLWQWGQFLDHDIDLTDGVVPAEPHNVPIPTGDPWFDPDATGAVTLAFNRSIYDAATGDAAVNPRQQINEITGWIDASNVYGSDTDRAAALRTNDGTGRLRTSAGNLLPFNHDGLANAGGSASTLFLAGDVRANEQLGLTAMHTLFVREHNRLAGELREANPTMDGDEIYQRARRLVGAFMQAITYNEFLPVLLGAGALAPYRGYDESVDARIANAFSTAAYRLGHSMLSGRIMRLDASGAMIDDGHLSLRDAFFSPSKLLSEGGIDPILRGLAAQICEDIDAFVVDDVRNTLFGAPGSGGFDLVALNIQRGRDHGLPSYNDAREAMGMLRYSGFEAMTDSEMLRARLADAYDDVDAVDLWVGGLAETKLPGSALGELFHHMVVDQFEALRDGDRFWYEASLTPAEVAMVKVTKLSDIIRRNTDIDVEIQENVFIVP